MILDDDHGGIFSFDDAEVEVVESVGTFELELKRISGARGKVAIPYNTEDGTAKEGEHYEAMEGELIFNNEETSKTISLEITDEESTTRPWRENSSSTMRKHRRLSAWRSPTRRAMRRIRSCMSASENQGRLLRA